MSYMSIIVSIMTLPVCLSALHADVAFYGSAAPTYLSKMLAIATMATMFGKFVLGPPTDHIGGERTLKLTMFLISVSLYACSISTNVQLFGLLWIALSFVYASAWGAIGKIVRERFLANEWSGQLGLVAAGSRVGSLVSSLLFAGLLLHNGWRTVFRVAAAIQVAILAFYHLLNKQVTTILAAPSLRSFSTATSSTVQVSNASPTESDKETVPAVLKRVASSAEFWFMLTGKVSLMCVGQFISFMPLYLSTGFQMAAPAAAAASSSFALGSLISSVLVTKLYQNMSTSQQIRTITVFNCLNCVLPALLWAHHKQLLPGFLGVTATTAPVVLFLWGAAWMLPFYIPPGVLALHLGGTAHAALLTNLFDGAGFLAASVVSFYAMSLGSKGHWAPVMGCLSTGGALALLGMNRAMNLALR
jgi:MFS family permease